MILGARARIGLDIDADKGLFGQCSQLLRQLGSPVCSLQNNGASGAGVGTQTTTPTLFRFETDGWLDLAAVQISIGTQAEVLASLQKAVGLGGNQVRRIIAQEPRFEAIRGYKPVQDLVSPATRPIQPIKLPF